MGKWFLPLWLAFLVLGCLPRTFALAKTERLTFDAGSALQAPDPRPIANGDPRPRLTVLGPDGKAKTYSLVVDKGTPYRALIDADRTTAASQRFLALTILPSHRDPEYPEHRKDKIQLHIGGDDERGAFDLDINSDSGGRYVGFDIKLDPNYQNPPRGSFLIHFQAWQEGGGHPPFAIAVRPTQGVKGPVNFDLYAVDDAGENSYYNERPKDWHRRLYSLEIERGRWYRFVLLLQPAYNGSRRAGRIELWVDGDQKLKWTGDWGYRPGRVASEKRREKRADRPVGSRLQLGLGVYRSLQDRTQTVYFDNVVTGDSYAAVASR
jgi:hypothetical protein